MTGKRVTYGQTLNVKLTLSAELQHIKEAMMSVFLIKFSMENIPLFT